MNASYLPSFDNQNSITVHCFNHRSISAKLESTLVVPSDKIVATSRLGSRMFKDYIDVVVIPKINTRR
jgi:hypothetical protein